MKNKKKRILMSVLGVTGCGISVGFFKRAAFGVDPFQAFMSGIDALIPVSFGMLYIIVNSVLILFSIKFDRTKIGIATWINLFFLGYIVDYSYQFLDHLFPELSIEGRIMMLIIGITAMCFSSSFYFTADLGVSTYDAVSLVFSEKYKKIPFRLWRVGCDFICISLGIISFILSCKNWSELGSMIGIGTVITAFFMGPLIQFFNEKIAQPYLNK